MHSPAAYTPTAATISANVAQPAFQPRIASTTAGVSREARSGPAAPESTGDFVQCLECQSRARAAHRPRATWRLGGAVTGTPGRRYSIRAPEKTPASMIVKLASDGALICFAIMDGAVRGPGSDGLGRLVEAHQPVAIPDQAGGATTDGPSAGRDDQGADQRGAVLGHGECTIASRPGGFWSNDSSVGPNRLVRWRVTSLTSKNPQ